MDTVKWLVANGADLSARTLTGSTAAERARSFGYERVAAYLDKCVTELNNPDSQLAVTRQTDDSM